MKTANKILSSIVLCAGFVAFSASPTVWADDSIKALMRGDLGVSGEAIYGYMEKKNGGVTEVFNAEVRVDLLNNAVGVDDENAESTSVIVRLSDDDGDIYADCFLEFTGLALDEEETAFAAHYSVKLRTTKNGGVSPDTGLCLAGGDEDEEYSTASNDRPGPDLGIHPVMPEVEEGDLATAEVNGAIAADGVFD